MNFSIKAELVPIISLFLSSLSDFLDNLSNLAAYCYTLLVFFWHLSNVGELLVFLMMIVYTPSWNCWGNETMINFIESNPDGSQKGPKLFIYETRMINFSFIPTLLTNVHSSVNFTSICLLSS